MRERHNNVTLPYNGNIAVVRYIEDGGRTHVDTVKCNIHREWLHCIRSRNILQRTRKAW